MNIFAELLPLCFVRWYALRHLARFKLRGNHTVFVQARSDVLIVVRGEGEK